MAYKHSDNCGPSASDNYEDWSRIRNTSNDWRYHKITGSGVVTTCSAYDTYPSGICRYHSMDSGITELADECFNKASVETMSLSSCLLGSATIYMLHELTNYQFITNGIIRKCIVKRTNPCVLHSNYS